MNVPDISCDHCERAITNVLTPVSGVHSVAVNIPAKLVRVTCDEAVVSVERMKETLREEDYLVASAEPDW